MDILSYITCYKTARKTAEYEGKLKKRGGSQANFITGLDEADGLAVASVPEPSTWAMIAFGGVALLGIMHRKKYASR